jgi:hypothetical protein
MIGVYEGGNMYTAGVYRPAGSCKMGSSGDPTDNIAEFCFVCKWLIVNRVNPSYHALLGHMYYPKAKKNG